MRRIRVTPSIRVLDMRHFDREGETRRTFCLACLAERLSSALVLYNEASSTYRHCDKHLQSYILRTGYYYTALLDPPSSPLLGLLGPRKGVIES